MPVSVVFMLYVPHRVLVLMRITGAYSNSQGIDVVREEVAKFLHERDGYPR